jgi:hypothetical protein
MKMSFTFRHVKQFYHENSSKARLFSGNTNTLLIKRRSPNMKKDSDGQWMNTNEMFCFSWLVFYQCQDMRAWRLFASRTNSTERFEQRNDAKPQQYIQQQTWKKTAQDPHSYGQPRKRTNNGCHRNSYNIRRRVAQIGCDYWMRNEQKWNKSECLWSHSHWNKNN